MYPVCPDPKETLVKDDDVIPAEAVIFVPYALPSTCAKCNTNLSPCRTKIAAILIVDMKRNLVGAFGKVTVNVPMPPDPWKLVVH